MECTGKPKRDLCLSLCNRRLYGPLCFVTPLNSGVFCSRLPDFNGEPPRLVVGTVGTIGKNHHWPVGAEWSEETGLKFGRGHIMYVEPGACIHLYGQVKRRRSLLNKSGPCIQFVCKKDHIRGTLPITVCNGLFGSREGSAGRSARGCSTHSPETHKVRGHCAQQSSDSRWPERVPLHFSVLCPNEFRIKQ